MYIMPFLQGSFKIWRDYYDFLYYHENIVNSICLLEKYSDNCFYRFKFLGKSNIHLQLIFLAAMEKLCKKCTRKSHPSSLSGNKNNNSDSNNSSDSTCHNCSNHVHFSVS